MDQDDDFQFKPINEGLGFHKKAANLGDELRRSGVVEDKVGKRMPSNAPPEDSVLNKVDAFRSIKDPEIKFYEKEDRDIFDRPSLASQIPLKNSETVTAKTLTPEIKAAPSDVLDSEIFKRTRKAKAQPEVIEETGVRLRPDSPHVGPMLLDLFVALGMASIFAVPLLMITEVNLEILFSGILTDITTQFSVGLLFVAVLSFYLIISRSFFFSTLGEWAFDQSLGSSRDRLNAFYPIRIAFRTIIMIVTGFATLPLIGMIMGEDYLGQFTGTEIRKSEINWDE